MKHARRTLLQAAHTKYQQLSGRDMSIEAFTDLLNAIDPSPRKKNVRWLAERLVYRLSPANEAYWQNLDPQTCELRRLLIAFEACKYKLPVKQRGILSYRSIPALSEAVTQVDRKRVTCKPSVLNALSVELSAATCLVVEDGVYSVYRPRSIEDAVALGVDQNALDAKFHCQGLYRSMEGVGEVLVFVSQGFTRIAVIPEDSSCRMTHVFDELGEPALFEDMIQCEGGIEGVSSEVLDLIIKADPTIPFDMELEDPELYVKALLSWPAVTMDREVPDELLDDVREQLESLRDYSAKLVRLGVKSISDIKSAIEALEN